MIGKARSIWRDEGAASMVARARRSAVRRSRRHIPIEVPVAASDVLAADITARRADPRPPAGAVPDRLRIDWVIPPVAKGAGGHGNIFRFVRALEQRGHSCRLFVYDPHGYQTGNEARTVVQRHFPGMAAPVRHGVADIGDCDALVATAWQTAYPVFTAGTTAGRFYWVQDYEPYFTAPGSEAALAEATYRFGLHGITLGRWLSTKLEAEYAMSCDPFEFGSDPGTYRLDRAEGRGKVLFYARPHTPRRGFELGVMALQLFHEAHPEIEIDCLGGDLREYRLPFPARQHGVLSSAELNELYNHALAALVLSFTNMSLLPLELLSAGCIPVVNDGDNNRMVSDNPHIAYSDATPHALARALRDVVAHPDRRELARAASESVRTLGWEQSADRVESIIFDVLHRRAAAARAPVGGPT